MASPSAPTSAAGSTAPPEVPIQSAAAPASAPKGKARGFRRSNLSSAPRGNANLPEGSNLLQGESLVGNSEHSDGQPFVITIVPDLRPCTIVYTEWIQRNYLSGTIKESSTVSPASILAYMLYCTIGSILIMEYETPLARSHFAIHLYTDPSFQSFLTELKSAYIPEVVASTIKSFAPFKLEGRRNVLFIHSFSTMLHDHDMGRIIPPSIFLQAHDNLRTPPRIGMSYLFWLTRTAYEFDGADIKVGHLLGCLFDDNTQNHNTAGQHYQYHENWFSKFVVRFGDSITVRDNSRRPLLSAFNVPTLNLTSNAINPYAFLLGLNDTQFDKMNDLIESISLYLENQATTYPQIQAALHVSAGHAPRHVISPSQAPTFHRSTITDIDQAHIFIDTDFAPATYANVRPRLRYGQSPGAGDLFRRVGNWPQTIDINNNNAAIDVNPNDFDSRLFYLAKSTTSDNMLGFTTPITSIRNETQAQVLLFDPYDANVSQHEYTIVSGRTIENHNVDGIMLQVANPGIELDTLATRFMVGTIPLVHCVRQFSTTDMWYLYPRERTEPKSHHFGYKLYNAFKDYIPRFDREHTPSDRHDGYDIVNRVNGRGPSMFSMFGVTEPTTRHARRETYLWSSYRVNLNASNARPTESSIYAYASLEGIFGTASYLTRVPKAGMLISLT
uniref:Capsid protein n=1 Tax=Grapevine-associated partitivirus 4 TaxID=2894777 RepID=A0A8K1THQ8_9VIRU|nr:MAG: capsid protein [Grapevine-associated partitivirus 4]